MRYKIGEVSKMLSIPAETIRYYENKGFIHPMKDTHSGYRYYDAWDINFLLEYKRYRSMGFSQEEILAIQNTDDILRTLERMKSRGSEIEREIQRLTLIKEKIDCDNNIIENIFEYTGRYKITRSPDIYYIINRYDAEYDTENAAAFKRWTELYPITGDSFFFDEAGIRWGFSIEKELAERIGFDVSAAEFIKGTKSLYTVVKSRPKKCFAREIILESEEYLAEKSYILNGTITGSLILRTHENGELIRYMRLWIPIK